MRFMLAVGGMLSGLLAGCSSGGGDGGGNGELRGELHLNRLTVSVERGLLDGSPDAEVVTGSLTNPSGDVFLIVDSSKTNLISEAEVFVDGNSGKLHLWPTAPGDLGPGVHQGEVTVKACGDALCSKQYQGSPKTISLTYTVTAPQFNIDRKNIEFVSYLGATELPSEQSVSVSSSTGVYSWASSVSSPSQWLTLDYEWQGETGGAKFNVVQAMAAGEYQAQVKLGLGGIGYHHVVDVIYRVLENPIQVSGGPLQFTVGSTTDASELQKSVTISHAPGATDFNWVASTDAPWLTLSKIEGNSQTDQEILLSVNSAVANLPQGQHTASFVVADASGTLSDNRIELTLSLEVPVVQGLFPYIAYPEQEQNIIVVGEGFSPESVVVVGEQIAPSVEYLSSTRLRVTLPALAKGNYPVFIQSTLGAAISESQVTVVDHPQFGATEFAYDDGFLYLYDPEREAVYSYYVSNGPNYQRPVEITAKRFVEGAWAEHTLDLGGDLPISAMNITPDGRYLVVARTNYGLAGHLDFIDLDAFVVEATYDSVPWLSPETETITFYTNQKAVFAGASVVFMEQIGKFEEALFLENFRHGHSYTAVVPAWGHIIFTDEDTIYQSIVVHNLDSRSTQQLPDVMCLAFTVKGDKCINRFGNVYEWGADNATKLGDTRWPSIFMPDGQHLVSYDNEAQLIRLYDVEQPDAGGFAATGDTQPFVPSPFSYAMVDAVTPDGRFVFLRLENRLAIVPWNPL